MRESLVPDLPLSTNHIFSSNLSKTPVQGSETLAELETKQKWANNSISLVGLEFHERTTHSTWQCSDTQQTLHEC